MGPPSGGLTSSERGTVLTKVRAYSSWEFVDSLLLDDAGRPETDLLQIRNIDGLDPVDASVNTTPLGSLDGDSYSGSSVGSRNIVLTVKPNPDWVTWTYEKLRRLLYTYFMPKRQIRLVFETDEIAPVEITGYVESISPAIFSADGEIQISVICPYPYFVAIDPIIVTGLTNDTPIVVDYDGTIETGINVEVTHIVGQPDLTSTYVSLGDVEHSTFFVGSDIVIDDSHSLIINSIPGNKYIRSVNLLTGVTTNELSQLSQGAIWPILNLGPQYFSVETAFGDQDWKLTYYKRYGGL